MKNYLTYTAIDPHADMPDIPENYTTVSYKLSPQDGGTMLEVTQGDFAKVAQGEKRYREVSSDGGWDGLLEQIKAIAEQR